MLEYIGGGSFGEVRKGRWKNTYVAVKTLKGADFLFRCGPVITSLFVPMSLPICATAASRLTAPPLTYSTHFKCSKSNENPGDHSSKVLSEFTAEAAIMGELHHPNIALLMGYSRVPPALILEYLVKGSLWNLIHEKEIPMTSQLMMHVLVESACGENFLWLAFHFS